MPAKSCVFCLPKELKFVEARKKSKLQAGNEQSHTGQARVIQRVCATLRLNSGAALPGLTYIA